MRVHDHPIAGRRKRRTAKRLLLAVLGVVLTNLASVAAAVWEPVGPDGVLRALAIDPCRPGECTSGPTAPASTGATTAV